MYHTFFLFFFFFEVEKNKMRERKHRNYSEIKNWKRGNDAISFNCETTITHTDQRNAILMPIANENGQSNAQKVAENDEETM